MNFIATSYCKLRRYCTTCRDLNGGRNWRRAVGRVFTLPSGDVDFKCPYGLLWGYVGKSRGLGDTIAKITKAVTLGKLPSCRRCTEKQKKLNRFLPYHKFKVEDE